MIDVLIELAVIALTGIVIEGIPYLLSLWNNSEEKPIGLSDSFIDDVVEDYNDIENRMIGRTKTIIQETIGSDIEESLGQATNLERINMMTEFANQLAKEYGLDIEIDVNIDSDQRCGYYSWEKKKAVFNLRRILIDKDDKNFGFFARDMVDTIIHELRHAVQHQAVSGDNSIWNVDEERRRAWAENFIPGNYIGAQANQRGYFNQPVERDAFGFAGAVMRGVN